MTPDQFRAWRKYMRLSRPKASALLGGQWASVRTLAAYEKGESKIPVCIELACAALALGIRSYSGPDHDALPSRTEPASLPNSDQPDAGL